MHYRECDKVLKNAFKNLVPLFFKTEIRSLWGSNFLTFTDSQHLPDVSLVSSGIRGRFSFSLVLIVPLIKNKR